MPGDVVYARPRRSCGGCLFRGLFLLLAIPVALVALPFLLGLLDGGGGGGQVGPADPQPTVILPGRTSDAVPAPQPDGSFGNPSPDPVRTQGGDLVITGTECPRVGIGAFSGIAVGSPRTTCRVATAVQGEYVSAVAATPSMAGAPVTLTVATTGAAAVRWRCVGARPAVCTSPDAQVVYLYTGAAIVR